ncbi:hypothetical protein PAXRUDRAFT_20034 [Paxillus rubicundulus Ve08.2h10]|uniref:Unplaced genomic scaffold scaffold_4180, whole genome shotgun sequence n=1 Tax=Paxillus rubicundulus Ve08.2h10 TaxID=930991 RepID=A0A0D0CFX4_9AGAM|nr:hypothetical protein PAXRUDRAFT_20034 [Paxillus rubicundulus Ve08.2h10]
MSTEDCKNVEDMLGDHSIDMSQGWTTAPLDEEGLDLSNEDGEYDAVSDLGAMSTHGLTKITLKFTMIIGSYR